MPLEALEEREANRLGNTDRSSVLGGSNAKDQEPVEPVDVETGLDTIGAAVGNSQKRKPPADNVSNVPVLCLYISFYGCNTHDRGLHQAHLCHRLRSMSRLAAVALSEIINPANVWFASVTTTSLKPCKRAS